MGKSNTLESLLIAISSDGQRALKILPQEEEWFENHHNKIFGGHDDAFFQIQAINAISEPRLKITIDKDEYHSCDMWDDDNWWDEKSCTISAADFYRALSQLKAGEETVFVTQGEYINMHSRSGVHVEEPYSNDDVHSANFLFKVLLSPNRDLVTVTVMVQNENLVFDLFAVCHATEARPRSDKFF
jgi:hypothetical protein